MAVSYLAFQSNTAPANTNKTWNDIRVTASALALLDEAGAATGWSVTSTGGATGFNGGAESVGTGDAIWVDEAAIMNGGHTTNDSVNWHKYAISGLTDGAAYNIAAAVSMPVGRKTDIRFNGGAVTTITSVSSGETDSVQLFSGLTPSAGVIEFEWKSNDGTSAYVNAAYVEEVITGPALTVTPTDLPLTPGSTISGTYADYETVPTTLTVSDGTNTVTISSPTINDNGDGTGDFSGTMPALPTTGTANLILFGDVDVELT